MADNNTQKQMNMSQQRVMDSPLQSQQPQQSVMQQSAQQGAELSAQATQCPFCGAPVDADSDLCEACHHYIRTNICSFCGADMEPEASFCAECGSPRAGIECPICHTVNEFSFCKQCGAPLTEEAIKTLNHVKTMPEYQEMSRLASELLSLEMEHPVMSQREEVHLRKADEIRIRVLTLLAKDEGQAAPDPDAPRPKHYSQDQIQAAKSEREQRLAELMQKMAAMPQPRSAQARTYALATKPRGLRLAWQCDWKHALHSSPCGCAKPQLGGKWVLLGRTAVTHDDN